MGLKHAAGSWPIRSRPSPRFVAAGPKLSTGRLQTDATDGDADQRHSGHAANATQHLTCRDSWQIRVEAANIICRPPLLKALTSTTWKLIFAKHNVTRRAGFSGFGSLSD
jgi:hypothetical protein